MWDSDSGEPHEPQALRTRTVLRVSVGEERLHDKEREKLSRTRPLPSSATIRPAPTSVAEAAPRGSLSDSHRAEVALRDLVARPRGSRISARWLGHLFYGGQEGRPRAAPPSVKKGGSREDARRGACDTMKVGGTLVQDASK
jgi:hypothetical protein